MFVVILTWFYALTFAVAAVDSCFVVSINALEQPPAVRPILLHHHHYHHSVVVVQREIVYVGTFLCYYLDVYGVTGSTRKSELVHDCNLDYGYASLVHNYTE